MTENQERLLELIRREGPITQDEAEERTGLARSVVSKALNGLLGDGVVTLAEPGAHEPRGKGRPPGRYALSPKLGLVLGVEFELGYVGVAISDLSLSAEQVRREKAEPENDDFETVMDSVARLASRLLAEAGGDRSKVVGLVMSVPAPVGREDGLLRPTTLLPDSWRGQKPAEALRRRLAVPVDVDNDATLSALADGVLGAARGWRHVLYVKVSTGVGCGLLIDGQTYGGAGGTAGELAHMMIDPAGRTCLLCGQRGCLHTLVGAEAILARVSERWDAPRGGGTPDRDLAKVIGRATVGPDANAWTRAEAVFYQAVIRDTARYLGVAVANVCNILSPQRVVIGGELSKAGNLLLEPLRTEVRERTSQLSPQPEVVLSRWSEHAEVYGALAQALRGPNGEFRDRLLQLARARSHAV